MSQQDDLSRLAEELTDEDFRYSFTTDHEQALSNAGVDKANIPEPVLEALKDCSLEELRALARVRNALVREDVPPEIIVQIV